MSPPSDRTSMLRGLRQGGVGENNLVFRCTRRRLVIETLHLDVEGGVGERRTTAPPAEKSAGGSVRAGMAAVEIEIEGTKERKTKQVKFEAIDL
jgi:elongator complex protein 4